MRFPFSADLSSTHSIVGGSNNISLICSTNTDCSALSRVSSCKRHIFAGYDSIIRTLKLTLILSCACNCLFGGFQFENSEKFVQLLEACLGLVIL